MKETKRKMQKGSDGQLRVPVGPCAVGQKVHCTNGS